MSRAELLDLGNCRAQEDVWCVVKCSKQLSYVEWPIGHGSWCRQFLENLGVDYGPAMASSAQKKGPLYIAKIDGEHYLVYNGCLDGLEYEPAKTETEKALVKLLDTSLPIWAVAGAAVVMAGGGYFLVKTLRGRHIPLTPEFQNFFSRAVTHAVKLEVPSRAPNKAVIGAYINAACGIKMDILKVLLNGIQHVPYASFEKALDTAISNLDRNSKYVLCLYSSTGGVLSNQNKAPGTQAVQVKLLNGTKDTFAIFCQKSNFWTSCLVFSKMTTAGYDVEVSTNFNQDDRVLLICDDAIYSGSQIKYTVSYYATFNRPISVVVAFCSQHGFSVINQYISGADVQFHVGEWMKTPDAVIAEQIKLQDLQTDIVTIKKELSGMGIGPDKNWYYFDHKWPDDNSFLLQPSSLQLRGLFGVGCDKKPIPGQILPFPVPFDAPYSQSCNV
jgi:hypothetical protein